MSERGVVAIDRGIFDHECFADEPFTEREAWMWLIAEAAWKPRARRIGKQIINLERGQLAASVRFMAEKWKWSKSRVERYLERLKIGRSCRGGRPKKTLENPPLNSGTLIETQTETGILIITICNYAKYQRVSIPNETHTGTQSGTAARQQRDKREDIKNIESYFSSSSAREERKTEPPSDDWPPDYRERFWTKYPHKVGKPDALEKLDRVRKTQKVPWMVLWGGLERYVGKTDDRPWCNPATWIHQQRWTDEPAAGSANGQAQRNRSPDPGSSKGRGFSSIALERARAAEQHDEGAGIFQPGDRH